MTATSLAASGRWVRRGPIIIVDLEGGGRSGSEFQEEMLDRELGFGSFPSTVLDALRRGLESFAVQLAVKAGFRDESKLASLVFYARHPERGGRPLEKSEPGFKALSQEWLDIRDRLVRPALAQQPRTPTTPSPVIDKPLKWGVPGGVISDPFYRSNAEARKLFGKPGRRDGDHLGIDVTGAIPGKAARTVNDLRRGLPVYATIKPEIAIADLNEVRVMRNRAKTQPGSGLGIDGVGQAKLHNALVLVQPWETTKSENVINQWGGIIGLACRYRYQRLNGSSGTFTLYIEYLHLITRDYPPIDKFGNKMASPDEWIAMGKRLGFGPKMQNRKVLSASELTAGEPLLVGYLGATASPHVHVNANYEAGEKSYRYFPRLDPTAMIY